MDEAVRHVRHHASRELGDRRGAKRRYSAPLRQAAVAYWREREHAGETEAQVAQRLGVAPMSLRWWAQDERFHPVHVVPDPVLASGVTLVVDASAA